MLPKINFFNIQLLQLTYFFSFEIDDADDDEGDNGNFRLNTEIVQDLIQHVQSFSDALQQLRNTFKDGFIGMYISLNNFSKTNH